ncbi:MULTISPECIES: glycosyltransferase family 2 protein [Kocuria]|uniref:Glycosyltransferase family 2 protein n=1 Tax=Kocuria atrinae TaxID=592377 RepID=A0ABP5IZB5_9MICC|nr:MULTISPECIES: glycosyltransferase family 2 protein [Kocuria]MDN5699089.1 glycosyltransferase family 2 protein [Kocuria sp.]
MSRAWIVMPVYNEGQVVGEVLENLRKTFPHVVCIDDGSSDDSARICREAGAVVVSHPINLGQGAALQTGFEYALQDPDMDCVVTFDSDGQHRVVDAYDMVQRIRSGEADVVLGSRFLDDRTQVSKLKRLVLRTAAFVSKFTSGMDLSDAHNGLRAINRKTLQQIDLKQNRMAHASEIVNQFAEIKPHWVEHPVEIIYTDYSKGKGQSLLNGVNILTELFVK